jgi:hypothetical protein
MGPGIEPGSVANQAVSHVDLVCLVRVGVDLMFFVVVVY